MGKFFREYWAWILVPFVVVIAAVAVLALTGDEGSIPFTYEIF